MAVRINLPMRMRYVDLRRLECKRYLMKCMLYQEAMIQSSLLLLLLPLLLLLLVLALLFSASYPQPAEADIVFHGIDELWNE